MVKNVIILLILLGSSLACFPSKTWAFPGMDCRQVVKTCHQDLQLGPDGLNTNKIFITSEADHSVIEILNTLKIDQSWIDARKNKKESVLSVGEGLSSFSLVLRTFDLDIRGLDIWYDRAFQKNSNLPKQVRSFVQRQGINLVTGSAFDLPYKPESLDHLVSHKFMNNLHIGESVDFLISALKVLKVGGSLRISDISLKRFQALEEAVLKPLQNKIQISYQDGLLVVVKVASVQGAQILNPYDSNKYYPGLPMGPRMLELMSSSARL